MRIKIIKAKHPQRWYANKIGQTFDTVGNIFKFAGEWVFLVDGSINGRWPHFVDKDDAVIV